MRRTEHTSAFKHRPVRSPRFAQDTSLCASRVLRRFKKRIRDTRSPAWKTIPMFCFPWHQPEPDRVRLFLDALRLFFAVAVNDIRRFLARKSYRYSAVTTLHTICTLALCSWSAFGAFSLSSSVGSAVPMLQEEAQQTGMTYTSVSLQHTLEHGIHARTRDHVTCHTHLHKAARGSEEGRSRVGFFVTSVHRFLTGCTGWTHGRKNRLWYQLIHLLRIVRVTFGKNALLCKKHFQRITFI